MLSNRVRELRKKAGLTQEQLAQRVEVSKNTVLNWETGKRNPREQDLKRLAQAFGVTVSYLMEETEDFFPSQPGALAERNIQEIVSNVATMNEAIPVPVVTNEVSACCGKGNIYAEEVRWEITGYYPMDPTDLMGYTWRTKNFCIIRAEGDSMEPHIHDGDRVLFAKSPDVEVASGDFAILLWDGKLLIRGVVFPDERRVLLRPTNKDYEDIETGRGDERLCVLGKVLGVTPAYRKTPGLW